MKLIQQPQLSSTIRTRRVVVVALGLIATGAAVGAACGAVAVSFLLLAARTRPDGSLAMVGGLFGAGLGAVLGPLAGFSILRHVPLGRAIGWTALGAVIGGAVGIPLAFGVLVGPVVGFGIAALALYGSVFRSRRDHGRSTPADPRPGN